MVNFRCGRFMAGAFVTVVALGFACGKDDGHVTTDFFEQDGTTGAPNCFSEPLFDADMKVEGLQADCTVVEQKDRSVGGKGQTFKDCNAGGGEPCWSALINPSDCAKTGYEFRMRRPEGVARPAGVVSRVSCQTCVKDDTREGCQ